VAGPDRQGPELIEGETAIEENRVVTSSIRSSFASASGSVVSFQVLVRWNVIRRWCRTCRSRSRLMTTFRAGSGAVAH
jgi:hypothetical protein